MKRIFILGLILMTASPAWAATVHNLSNHPVSVTLKDGEMLSLPPKGKAQAADANLDTPSVNRLVAQKVIHILKDKAPKKKKKVRVA